MNIFEFDIIFDIIIIIILILILYVLIKKREPFIETVGDQITAMNTLYNAEVNSSYFKSLLDAANPTDQVVPDNMPEIYNENARSKALNRSEDYLESLINKDISTSFKTVQSKIISYKFYSKEKSYVHTVHLVYRDTKMYGTRIELWTLQDNPCTNFIYDNKTGIDKIIDNHRDNLNIILVKYNILETVSEDKILLVAGYDPNSLDNAVADYTFKEIIPEDSQVQLCDHYKKFKEDTGIDPDINKEC